MPDGLQPNCAPMKGCVVLGGGKPTRFTIIGYEDAIKWDGCFDTPAGCGGEHLPINLHTLTVDPGHGGSCGAKPELGNSGGVHQGMHV